MDSLKNTTCFDNVPSSFHVWGCVFGVAIHIADTEVCFCFTALSLQFCSKGQVKSVVTQS